MLKYLILIILTISLQISPARAEEPAAEQHWLPTAPLSQERAAALMTAERLGPPATTYDHQRRTPEAATADERQIEALALGSRAEELAAPDALRRYGRLSLALRQEGQLHTVHEWFLAEHVGLALPPFVVGWFTCSKDPKVAGDQVKKMIADTLGESDLQAISVTLVDRTEEGAWLGQITALSGAADFEPFSRVYQPGEIARIPGTTLKSRFEYALFVGRKDIVQVDTYPLTGEGRFDVEFPLPEQGGVVRVAMSQNQRRRMPDNRFFFTLYVGSPPPTSLGMLDIGLDAPLQGRTLADEESGFIASVNAERQRFNIPAVVATSDTAQLRTIVVEAPTGSGAFKRYLERVGEQDPAPGTRHGLWESSWCSGVGGRDAAWACLEHPAIRQGLLDPAYSTIAVGAGRKGENASLEVVTFMIAPPEDGEAVRSAAYTTMDGQYSGKLKRAPKLQDALDAIAAEVASGSKSLNQGMKALEKLVKKSGLVHGESRFGIQVQAAGHAPDLTGYKPTPTMSTIAIGQATGNMGQGENIDYVVLIVVNAGSAD